MNKKLALIFSATVFPPPPPLRTIEVKLLNVQIQLGSIIIIVCSTVHLCVQK